MVGTSELATYSFAPPDYLAIEIFKEDYNTTSCKDHLHEPFLLNIPRLSLFRMVVIRKNDLLNRLLIDDISLHSLSTLENLFDCERAHE